MKVTILGSGTSIGVPMPTCKCKVCTSQDPKDNRLRCSALVETDEGKQILIDCGPDFRMQSLRADITQLDALLLTHNHFDHCYGLDDLRPWAYFKPLPTYADALMSQALQTRWDYIFIHRYPGVPKLELTTLHPDQNHKAATHRLSVVNQADIEASYKGRHAQPGQTMPVFSEPLVGTGGQPATFFVGSTSCEAIRCFHGAMPMLGYRIGRLAYITDCTLIPETEYSKLQDIDTLVIDALRWQEHPTHYSVAQALEIVQRLHPRQTFFTHMSHDIGLHKDFEEEMMRRYASRYPESFLRTIHLSYDQQVIDCL